MEARRVPPRKDGRVIIHFDYDCFYASVFEAKNPSLRSLPFAVQQKQIIVTCNYEARRRGLHKLQLITEAKRICPDVIIELGEDISKFRDASKELYNYISGYSWNGKIERLGFDEVWMDVTNIVDYNMETLNRTDLQHSFFQLSKDDPTQGFDFDASLVAGHMYPKQVSTSSDGNDTTNDLALRLRLGSHLALYMRHQLEDQQGYTCTVGIATNKLLSKLVGNMNKPKGQTTLMPRPTDCDEENSNIATFMDEHEIGKVPGIGFKLAQKLREFVLQRPPELNAPYSGSRTKECITVADVRNHPEINFEQLEKLLGGPGSPHGIGYKVWCLMHGIDDTEVSQARAIPRQISIEDSYTRLDTFPELLKQLMLLARSLITRMRIDLLADDDDFQETAMDSLDHNLDRSSSTLANKKWLAHPKTLRLSTRPRLPLLPDGTRPRTMKRISHSCPLPNFVFSIQEGVESLAEKLVRTTLLHMFRKLHPEKSVWNLSLINVAVTNMAETGGESKTASGRDIGNMLRKQEDVLKDFRVIEMRDEDVDVHDGVPVSETLATADDDSGGGLWDDGDHEGMMTEFCSSCGSHIPTFATVAHQRFHSRAFR
jgi:DNA polymerase iota